MSINQSTFSFRITGLLLFALLLSVAGCDLFGEDDPPTTVTSGVYVANQGNFSEGDGSVSVYDPEAQEVGTAISSSTLGSTIQSAAAGGAYYFVVSNTAQRVDVFAGSPLERVGQTEAVFDNPRYLALVTNNKAYVTDQVFGGTSRVAVLDMATLSVTDSIEVSGSPEDIAVTGNRAYAALGAFSDTTLVAAIDAASDELIEEIDIGCYARFVLSDADGEVFAFCNTAEGQGQAVVLEGSTGEEIERLDLGGTVRSAEGVTQDASHASEVGEMYVVVDENRVVRIDTQTNTLAATLGSVGGAPIGALGYDPLSEQLYLGRVPGFDQAGTVTIHERDGTQVGSFEVGIAPTDVHFRRN